MELEMRVKAMVNTGVVVVAQIHSDKLGGPYNQLLKLEYKIVTNETTKERVGRLYPHVKNRKQNELVVNAKKIGYKNGFKNGKQGIHICI